jgi:signal transduction histidine kinase
MAQRQQHVSDVFHTLGQPLTELQVSLELALHKNLDAAGYRATIQRALDATQRVIQSAKFVRQLAEADDPGANAGAVDFAMALRETVEEFEPVAECNHVEIGRIIEERLLIWADPNRIRRALFLLMDHCLHSAQPGTRMHVTAKSSDGFVVVEIATRAQELLWREQEDEPILEHSADTQHRSLQLAERMIAAIGGTLTETSASAGTRVEIRIPIEFGNYRQSETGTLVL